MSDSIKPILNNLTFVKKIYITSLITAPMRELFGIDLALGGLISVVYVIADIPHGNDLFNYLIILGKLCI